MITHVILGLPGESVQDMKDTVSYVAGSGAKGIKLQLLHVLKGTDLEKDYRAGLFDVMSEDEYIELIAELIGIIPGDMVVHRITGDGDKRLLTAPMWSANKREVLNRMRRRLSM